MDGEYNVDMSMTVLYEANVPDHDILLDILLTDKYATIESIHEVALPATLTSLAYWFAVIVTSASVTVVGTLNVYFKPFEILENYR